jgi:cytochrome c oxidase cbb3-type subunit 3
MSDQPEPKRGDYARKKGEVILREHEYDGIQEYDQKLPNWWLYTLFGAILFFLVDWGIYYKTDWVKSDHDKIEDALTKIRIKQESELEATLATLDDSILVHTWAQDSAIVASGKQLYNTICFTCHGAQLDAPQKLGLSLIDGTWKYGAAPLDIFKIINEGTPTDSKGMDPTGARMIPWGQQYTPKQIAEVTAFLISKNPKDFTEY